MSPLLRTRRPPHLAVAGLLALLCVAQAQYELSVVGQVWWLILSWDNPATHDFELLASETPPPADPVGQAHAHPLAATASRERLPAPPDPRAPRAPDLSARVPRAPPVVPAA